MRSSEAFVTFDRWWPPERAGRVTVTSGAVDARTLVTLEHAGRDGYEDPVGARDGHHRGWPWMLGPFRDRVDARTGSGDGVDPQRLAPTGGR